MLSVIGTAAVINHQFTTSETGKGQTVALLPPSAAKDLAEKDSTKEMRQCSVNEADKLDNNSIANQNNGNVQTSTGCSLCHVTYTKLSLPVNGKMRKCAVCKWAQHFSFKYLLLSKPP